MDFSLSAEQKALRREVLAFAASELQDDVADRDRRGEFSAKLWRRCGEQRLQGLPIPESLGGRGLDATSTAVALEALGLGCRDGGLVFALGAHLLACTVPLWRFGTEAQQQRWLPDLCRGTAIGALAMTEEASGSDAYALTSRAEATDEGFQLEGTKTYITNAPVADLLIVGARTEDPTGSGVTAFLVPTTSPGVELEPALDLVGLRTAAVGKVQLREVRVDRDAVLGRLHQGGAVFQEAMDWERTGLFASHLGSLEWLLERARQRARARRPGNGEAIGSHQAVSHRLADCRVQWDAARLLVYRAAWQLDRGRSATLQASIAKLFVSETLVRSAYDTLRVHGGDGLLRTHDVERALRDSLASTLYSGTSEIQRNLIAAFLGL